MSDKGWFFRIPPKAAAVALIAIAATGVTAAAVLREAVTTTTGSGGSEAVLQTNAKGGAFQAEVASKVTKTYGTPFALFGNYDPSGSNPPYGIGVVGQSTTGPGVYGVTANAQPGIYARNNGSGDALFAVNPTTTGDDAIYAVSFDDFANAVTGVNYSTATNLTGGGTGVLGVSYVSGGFGMFGGGFGATVPAGVVGEAEYGVSKSMPGFTAAILSTTYSIGEDLYEGNINDRETIAFTAGSANASGTVTNNPSAYGSDLYANGDLYLTGAVFSACSTFPYPKAQDCVQNGTAEPSSDGQERETYASRHASPTMEDEGEARLEAGYAHVSLDPDFAKMIAPSSKYLVFVTPQGDSRGLFVNNVSPAGFDVRENQGGRSTMLVDYRIVAHPYADASRRLAIARPARMAQPNSAAMALFAKRLANARAQGRPPAAMPDIATSLRAPGGQR